MAKIAGRNRNNRPFFFFRPDGSRVEFPSLSEGSGDLEGDELRKFHAFVESGQIELIEDRIADSASQPETAVSEPEAKPEVAVEVEKAEEPAPAKRRGRPRKEK